MKQTEETIQSTALNLVNTLYSELLISLSLSGIQLLGTAQEKARVIAVQKRSMFRKGLPDVTLYLPDSLCIGLEFKTLTGVQSIYQKEVEQILNKLGHFYYIVRSTDEVLDTIADHTTIEYRQQCYNTLTANLSEPKLTAKFLMFEPSTPTELVKQAIKQKYRL